MDSSACLHEPRIRRVIQPLIAGEVPLPHPEYDEDVSYTHDLGLVALKPLRVANPIYREVILRVLTSAAEEAVNVALRSFVLLDGRLDLRRLLEEFSAFWREHGDTLFSQHTYHEIAPQLVLMAFLQRVVNSGGSVQREYGVGRGRIDLLVRWPYTDATQQRHWQREALEIKVWAPRRSNPLQQGLTQLGAYLQRLDLPSGTLILFDRRGEDAPPLPERLRFETNSTPDGKTVTVLWL